MIEHLHTLLRRLFITRVPGITTASQVRFQPPDEKWRILMTHINKLALNVYLIDVRENRILRSNQRLRAVNDGVVFDTPAPRRIDCHYFISAWNPAEDSLLNEASTDEHALLYRVTSALTRFDSFVPREIFAPAPLPAGFPAAIADEELPMTLLPIEGFPKYAEFWGTMGMRHPWKPAVWLVITLPVVCDAIPSGPMVTTRFAEFRLAEASETLLQIGGHVLSPAAPPAPVAEAWVRLLTRTGESRQVTKTNELGRFTFDNLLPGAYRLEYQAAGLGRKQRDIEVPSPTGEYDLQF